MIVGIYFVYQQTFWRCIWNFSTCLLCNGPTHIHDSWACVGSYWVVMKEICFGRTCTTWTCTLKWSKEKFRSSSNIYIYIYITEQTRKWGASSMTQELFIHLNLHHCIYGEKIFSYINKTWSNYMYMLIGPVRLKIWEIKKSKKSIMKIYTWLDHV